MDAQFGLTVSALRTEGTGTQPCPHFMCMTHTVVLYQLLRAQGTGEHVCECALGVRGDMLYKCYV